MPPPTVGSVAKRSKRVIVVTGEGVAEGSPDICDLLLGLQSSADAPGAALEAVTSAASAVLAAVKLAGVPESDLQTSGLVVHEWQKPGQPDTAGYVANYALTVAGRPVDSAGQILTMATGANGDALRVNGIRLRFSEPGPLRREARRRAVDDARNRAEDLALAGALRLGAILRIEATGGWSPRLPGRAVGFATAAAPVPIEQGTASVVDTVIVTFAIDD